MDAECVDDPGKKQGNDKILHIFMKVGRSYTCNVFADL